MRDGARIVGLRRVVLRRESCHLSRSRGECSAAQRNGEKGVRTPNGSPGPAGYLGCDRRRRGIIAEYKCLYRVDRGVCLMLRREQPVRARHGRPCAIGWQRIDTNFRSRSDGSKAGERDCRNRMWRMHPRHGRRRRLPPSRPRWGTSNTTSSGYKRKTNLTHTEKDCARSLPGPRLPVNCTNTVLL